MGSKWPVTKREMQEVGNILFRLILMLSDEQKQEHREKNTLMHAMQYFSFHYQEYRDWYYKRPQTNVYVITLKH